MKMSSKSIFQLITGNTHVPEYLYTLYINTQTNQQKDENTFKYVSGAKDQEG